MIEAALATIQQGSCHLFGQEELKQKLRSGRPLRVKAGFDPTAPDLHLGHTVLFSKLRQLQCLGHHIIFIIGDFTAQIGDPTGKNATRPPLTSEVITYNTSTYQKQYAKVLDPNKTECRFNSEWLQHLSARELIQLASEHTVARMLERDDFHQRYHKHQPIAIHEFLYPLLQAYDSVVLTADIEIGGTDQLFNLLCGRELQKQKGLSPQAVLTLPLLEGLDGVQKMSKSLNNAIGLQEEAFSMYSKLMSISDMLMWRYFELLSVEKTTEQLHAMQQAVQNNAANPRDYKRALAIELTKRYHGRVSALQAQAEFIRRFQAREPPTKVPEYMLEAPNTGIPLTQLLQQVGLTQSTSEARRLIQSGAVRIEGKKIGSIHQLVPIGTTQLYQIGKRRFAKVTLVNRDNLRNEMIE
jgi:tyrosyl-tRNA synthetase